MKTIRVGVFETNSSSTHTMVLVGKEDWEKFKEGILLYDKDGGKFVETKTVVPEEMFDELRNALVEDWDEMEGADDVEDRYATHSEMECGFDRYETDEKEFTTKSGDTVVAFSWYGYD